MTNILIEDLFRTLVKALVDGGNKTRIPFYVAIFLIALGGLLMFLVNKGYVISDIGILANISFVVSILIILGIYTYQSSLDITKRENKLEEVEHIVKENPTNTVAVWELGRIKLEGYLDRNLAQVRSIFYLTITIMLIGFIIIAYGISKVYNGSNNLSLAILTTTTGIIIEFIGGSFLLIYKSTMQQAKDYVTVLERINAVGMSVQILDSISDDGCQLKDQTKAELSKKLLELYGGIK